MRTLAALALRTLRDPRGLGEARKAMLAYHTLPEAECPACGFTGRFLTYGRQARTAVRCPACHSLDRHRLLVLAAQRGHFDTAGKRVLHFAPEPAVTRLIRSQQPAEYRTADLKPGAADVALDIEDTGLAGAAFDMVVASHVLEHVDDRRALAELHRILAPGGLLVVLTPVVEGWARTYEDPAIPPEARDAHFGQHDHVRWYGADIRARLAQPGFTLEEFTADGPDSARYRLTRGEKVFFCRKT